MDDGTARTAVPSPPPAQTPAQRLRTVHQRMVEAVLGGDGLGEVAELAAEAAGAPVAIVVPRLDAAVASRGARADLAALRRYVAERCRGRPVPVPGGVAAEVAIQSGGDIVGGVLVLGDPSGPEGGEFLQIAALAALTEVAIVRRPPAPRSSATCATRSSRSCARGRPPGGDEIRRRGAQLGCDLRRGAVALCAELESERPRHMVALVSGEYEGVLAHCLQADGRPALRARPGRRGARGDRWPPPRRLADDAAPTTEPSASRASTASRASSGARSARPSSCSTCCGAATCRSARTSAPAPTGCCSACSPRTPRRCAPSTRTPIAPLVRYDEPTAPSWSRRSRPASSTTAPRAPPPARSTSTATRSPTGSSA